MPGVARVADLTLCPVLLPLPHIGGPLLNAAPVCLQADGRPIVRLGDFSNCLIGPNDVVAQGAMHFTVCGLPVARRGDKMIHHGLVITASGTVEIGGPAFELPSNVKVKGPATFQNQTIRDLYMLSTTKTGRDVLSGLEASKQRVVIVPESDPHNSFAQANDYGKATDGTGTGSTVKYNPDVAIYANDAEGNKIPIPPQIVLGHELIHALHNAHGDNATNGPDPHGPASQPGISSEEAYTIGTGSYDGAAPTENGIRADVGLPRRDNHYGSTTDAYGNELTAPPVSLRPGDC